MKMTILSAGSLTTVQDEGRFGFMQSGFSPSGAMDIRSLRIANLLVGNSQGQGALEMTMMGITAKFDCDAVIAITGADMQPKIGEEDCPMYEAVQVKKGSVLKMKAAKSGMRAYLAVAGGFDLALVMGSMSTNMKCKVGGFEGRKLQNGDEIPLRFETGLSLIGHRKIKCQEKYPKEITVRVILGPQDFVFSEKGIETFLCTSYTVTDKSDRMGIRLDGAKIESKSAVDIISDGVATGSIQIPAAGTPIIMMADRQTTGGYAKIATVVSADLPKIAQAKPGTKVNFAAVTPEEGAKIYKSEIKEMNNLEYTMMFVR